MGFVGRPVGMQKLEFIEKWKKEQIVGNLFRLTRSITMTGSNVDTLLKLPPHRLVRLECYHTDSAHAASTDALDVRFFRDQGKVEGLQYHLTDLLNLANQTASSIIKKWGEGYEYEGSTWTLRLNSTSGDIVEVALYIQVL